MLFVCFLLPKQLYMVSIRFYAHFVNIQISKFQSQTFFAILFCTNCLQDFFWFNSLSELKPLIQITKNTSKKWDDVCICHNSLYVQVNGSLSKDFKICKGLRQGDPISSFLFCLVVKDLPRMMLKAVFLGEFQGKKMTALTGHLVDLLWMT